MKEYSDMKEDHKYIAIGTVEGLLIEQLLVAFTDWNEKEYLVILFVMFLGMAVGVIKDKIENREKR